MDARGCKGVHGGASEVKPVAAKSAAAKPAAGKPAAAKADYSRLRQTIADKSRPWYTKAF